MNENKSCPKCNISLIRQEPSANLGATTIVEPKSKFWPKGYQPIPFVCRNCGHVGFYLIGKDFEKFKKRHSAED